MNIIKINDKDNYSKVKWKQISSSRAGFEQWYSDINYLPNIHQFKIENDNWEVHFGYDYEINIVCKNNDYVKGFFDEIFYSNQWTLWELDLDEKVTEEELNNLN